MIIEFIQSWPLFGPAYLTALSGAILLSMLGVYVVARDQVFCAAAVSQSSMLGVATSLFLGWKFSGLIAVIFSITSAVFINRRTHRGGATHQETTGWVFLLASALTIILLVKQPFSLKEVQALATSTMIGSTSGEALTFGLLGIGIIGLVAGNRQGLVLWLSDPVMAAAVGVKIGLWSLISSILLGLSAGLMIRSTGLLFTFACLVLPAMAAKYLSRDVSGIFWLSPVVAVAGVVPGLVLAHYFDLPPGQVIVVALAIITGCAALIQTVNHPFIKS